MSTLPSHLDVDCRTAANPVQSCSPVKDETTMATVSEPLCIPATVGDQATELPTLPLAVGSLVAVAYEEEWYVGEITGRGGGGGGGKAPG